MQIDKHIPVPDGAMEGRRRRSSKWPVWQMEIGDSIFVEGESTAGNVYSNIYNVARYHGMRVKGSTVEGGLRVWRVE